MMHCSPAMKIVAKISLLISSLAAIHMGLMEMGYNLVDTMKLAEYSRPLGYIVGIAGVISLVMLLMWCMKPHCGCGSGSSGSCGCH